MNRISHFYSKGNGRFAKIVLSALLAFAAFAVCATRAATAPKAPEFLPLNVHVGERAPDFGLLSADGQLVKLSQFAGKNVLLDFYEGYW